MYRLTVIAVSLVLLLSSAVFAGGGGYYGPGLYLEVKGILGWEGITGSAMTASISPPFYSNGEGNVSFQEPLHSDHITTAHWVDDAGAKLTTQYLSTPNAVGDYLYIGSVDVGPSDTRATQTFSLWVDNMNPATGDLTWFFSMYSRDTRRSVFTKLIESGDTNNWTTFSAKTSQSGYDVLAVAYNAAVPEPTSLVAMLTGMIGLAGWGTRRRRS